MRHRRRPRMRGDLVVVVDGEAVVMQAEVATRRAGGAQVPVAEEAQAIRGAAVEDGQAQRSKGLLAGRCRSKKHINVT